MNLRSAALAAVFLCAASPAPAQTLEEAMALYQENRLEESLPVFQALARATPSDAELRVWLAENQRRLNNPDAALELARAVLAEHPCHAFAHDVVASVYGYAGMDDPAAPDSAWAHARRAVACNPDDGNAWLTHWMMALLRRDTAAEAESARRVGEIGFVPEPVLEFARWMLRAAPPNAMLLANGDWDYLPLSVVQTVEGVRPDVTLVLRPTLELPWYVRRIAERTGSAPPPELAGLQDDEWLLDDEGNPLLALRAVSFWAAEWTAGRAPRPLVLAFTADVDALSGVLWPRWEGPLYTPRPLDEAPFGAEAALQADTFDTLLPLLDVSRLDGPLVHPTDRSPLRRNGQHPAEHLAAILYAYGNWRLAEERPDDAWRALSLLDALAATGHLRGPFAETPALLRESLEAGAEGSP